MAAPISPPMISPPSRLALSLRSRASAGSAKAVPRLSVAAVSMVVILVNIILSFQLVLLAVMIAAKDITVTALHSVTWGCAIPVMAALGIAVALVAMPARDVVPALVALVVGDGRPHDGKGGDPCDDGGGLAPVAGLDGRGGKAGDGHGRADDEGDELAVHDLSFQMDGRGVPDVRPS